jgi:hypothetical protein
MDAKRPLRARASTAALARIACRSFFDGQRRALGRPAGPVIVNIFFFHPLMAPEGLPRAIVVVVLWSILAVRYKQYLAGIFVQRAT